MSEHTVTDGPYGFAWGPILVERIAEIDGRVVLRVTTDAGRQVEVYSSRTGRSLRVFDHDGRELTPS